MFYDANFLTQLDKYPHKSLNVRITLLDTLDYPRQQIQGRVTGGSINVDGASAVRRSCSLTMVATPEEAEFTDPHWCYNNKFKLELGLNNEIDPIFADIIWFDMGIYLISSFSKSKSTNNFTITVQGKDKMARLNGDISGHIMAGTDFGTEEYIDKTTDNITITKLTIPIIIRNALRVYGQERDENIIINDLDNDAFELWEYRGDDTMYFIIKPATQTNIQAEVINMTFTQPPESLVDGFKFYSFNTLDENYNKDASRFDYRGTGHKEYCVAKIEYGETAGYHKTPLVYNNDLILNAGETVTAMLDKLKAMLGDFEYFYDLQGRFVFQKKKTYIQELFSPINGEMAIPQMLATSYSYKFEDENLFTSISSNPQINNVKNDFAVWGSRKGASGADLPIHARCGIQKKPEIYTSPYGRYRQITGLYYLTIETIGDLTDLINYANATWGWDISIDETAANVVSKVLAKQKLWQMVEKQEGKYEYIEITIDDNLNSVTTFYNVNAAQQGGEADALGAVFIRQTKSDKISYQRYFTSEELDSEDWSNIEYYYYSKNIDGTYSLITTNFAATPDLINIWEQTTSTFTSNEFAYQELIYQMAIDFYAHGQDIDFLLQLSQHNPQFINGKTGYEQYYIDMQAFWRQLYDPTPDDWAIDQYGEFYDSTGSDGKGNDDKYWNKKIHIDPHSLNFWFEILDSQGDLSKYNIETIGVRSKVVSEDSLKSIYYQATPEVQFIVSPEDIYTPSTATANKPIWIQTNMKEMFYRSGQGASILNKLNDLIIQHTIINESVSITSIPIYYLQPNTRIYVKGQGDFTVDKISYNLNYNGTMSLTCNKICQTLY